MIEFTEKDVKIITNNEIIYGKGFYASPDFTNMKLLILMVLLILQIS